MKIEYEHNFEFMSPTFSYFEAERWELTSEWAEVMSRCECAEGNRQELAGELLNVASDIIDLGEYLTCISEDLNEMYLSGPAEDVCDATSQAHEAVRTLIQLAQHLIGDGS